jgi:hypothetical protein
MITQNTLICLYYLYKKIKLTSDNSKIEDKISLQPEPLAHEAAASSKDSSELDITPIMLKLTKS